MEWFSWAREKQKEDVKDFPVNNLERYSTQELTKLYWELRETVFDTSLSINERKDAQKILEAVYTSLPQEEKEKIKITLTENPEKEVLDF